MWSPLLGILKRIAVIETCSVVPRRVPQPIAGHHAFKLRDQEGYISSDLGMLKHPYLKRVIRAIGASHIANDDQNRCRDHIPERSVLRQTGKATGPSPSADFDASRGWYT